MAAALPVSSFRRTCFLRLLRLGLTVRSVEMVFRGATSFSRRRFLGSEPRSCGAVNLHTGVVSVFAIRAPP